MRRLVLVALSLGCITSTEGLSQKDYIEFSAADAEVPVMWVGGKVKSLSVWYRKARTKSWVFGDRRDSLNKFSFSGRKTSVRLKNMVLRQERDAGIVFFLWIEGGKLELLTEEEP